MSSVETKYRIAKFILQWREYPRINYFGPRLIDFGKRFRKVTAALLGTVNSEEVPCLDDLIEKLGNTFNIVVIGEETLARKDLCFLPQSAFDPEKVAHQSVIDVIICYAVVESLDGNGVNIVALIAQQILPYMHSQNSEDSIIIFCKNGRSSTNAELNEFQADVHQKLKSSIGISVSKNNIIISPEIDDLKHHISLKYETLIMDGFVNIRSFLSPFVARIRRRSLNQSFEPMSQAILDFLRNGFHLCDIKYIEHNRKQFLTQLIERLARHIRCTITAPVASQHAMPDWLCARLLNDFDIEDALIKSVSNKSRYFLCKLESLFISAKTITQRAKTNEFVSPSRVRNVSRCLAFDFILPRIQGDFENVKSKADSRMSSAKRTLLIMNKMIQEIDGYLKQSIVPHISVSKKEPSRSIPDCLRRDILAIDGVYGIGTIYGEIEIHVDKMYVDTVQKITARLQSEHDLQNAYRIRQIKQ